MPEDLNSLLNAYLDGALPEKQRTALEARLSQPSVAKRLAALTRLRAGLGAAAPLPRPEQSRRMWMAIQAQVEAQAGPVRRPWYAFFTRPWAPVWSIGLVGAAAALLVVLMLPSRQPKPFEASTARQEQDAPAAAPDGPVAAKADKDLAAGGKADGAAMAGAAASETLSRRKEAALAEAPVSKGPTEVERALADNQVDDMIDQFLQARRSVPGVSLAAAPAPTAYRAAAGGAANVAYGDSMTPVENVDSSALGQAQGGQDKDGFWNWKPAALAMNQRDWRQTRLELEAASARAGAAAERSFASSALTLLSAPGAPLEGSVSSLAAVGDLRVLGAGRWQLLVDSRLASFSQGVSARLPGFRTQGNSLLLDLTFDRGTFAPGTRFTRVAGETAAKVVDAAAQTVQTDDFYAPAGADYNVQEREVRLR